MCKYNLSKVLVKFELITMSFIVKLHVRPTHPAEEMQASSNFHIPQQTVQHSGNSDDRLEIRMKTDV